MTISIRISCIDVSQTGTQDEVHVGEILFKSEEYQIVKLVRTVNIPVLRDGMATEINTPYLRLNTCDNEVCLYIPDSKVPRTDILEHLLTHHSEITCTYSPSSPYVWEEYITC